jgi:signal transduction histidine kinase
MRRTADDAFLSGGGEMGHLVRQLDWSATPLGPPANWPQSFRTALSLCLMSRFPMAVCWGPSYAIIYNDTYRHILGTKHPWAMGRPCFEVWSELAHIVQPMFDGVIATGEATWSDDLMLPMLRHGYLEEAYFTVSYSAVRGESERPEGILVTVTETTERYLAERRLQLVRELGDASGSARSLDQVFAAVQEILSRHQADVPYSLLYLVDEDGRHARLLASTHIPRDHVAAPAELSLVGEPSQTWPLRLAMSASEPIVLRDCMPVGPFARAPWPEPSTEAVLLPIPRPGRADPSAILVAGVNPRRALDAPHLEFFQLVARQIANAMANAVAHEETRRRAEALAELDRTKTAFFSNVSHEFRTPLTLMLGPLQDVLRTSDGLSKNDRQQLEVAHRNSQRLLKLVNSLLDFSRIEAGRIQASFEPVDLAAMTAELASGFRSAVERAGLRLVVRCNKTHDAVYVDREMWEKIVLNLLSNAFKFTFDGEIEVSLEQVADTVRLVVRDTGTGIPPEEVPHLFERFHRIRSARSRLFEGTGIGLALVQELVKQHGGTVAVDSVVNRGSTFTVTLPVGAAHLPADRVGAPRAASTTSVGSDVFFDEILRWVPGSESPTTTDAGPKDGRLLVVDDNADMREYLRRLLSRRYDVETACDGAEALRLIKARPPDVVLTDVMMPGLDGFALLASLRANVETRDICVVLLSARAGEESRVEGLDAGADDYIVKPFSANEMLARIASVMQLARLRREGEARLAQANRELRRRVLEQETLLDVLPIGIGIATDRDCRHIRINRAFAATLGLPPNANASKTASGDERPSSFRVCTPEGVEIPYEELPMQVAAREGIEVRDIEFDIVHDDGRIVRLLEYAAPLFDEQGEPAGAVGAFVDITARKEAATALQTLYRELEHANRVKDEFLATLSHELRTPLNAVIGWAHMLREGELTPAVRERALESLERNARAQAQLVEDLLDMSRIMTGKLHIKTEVVDLATVVANAVDTVRASSAAKELLLNVTIPLSGGCEVMGDADRLQQVVWNLMSNAIKFTPHGGRIDITLRKVDTRAEIVVQDTGVGIADSFRPYLFERFRQVETSTTRRLGGLGIGLSIVRHLTEAHGGTVEATSPGAGLGATFIVRLPLRAETSRRKSSSKAKRIKPPVQRAAADT